MPTLPTCWYSASTPFTLCFTCLDNLESEVICIWSSVFIYSLLREKIYCNHSILLRVTQDWVILSGKPIVSFQCVRGSISIRDCKGCTSAQLNLWGCKGFLLCPVKQGDSGLKNSSGAWGLDVGQGLGRTSINHCLHILFPYLLYFQHIYLNVHTCLNDWLMLYQLFLSFKLLSISFEKIFKVSKILSNTQFTPPLGW